jgi:SSS family solute:Na+ symporter/sodium/proline symporter
VTLAAFLVALAGFLGIGVLSAVRSTGTKQDYYVASSGVAPALVGLSAVATNNSGYMFIGVIGFTYATGLSAVWLMVGWIAGDFLASLVVHRKLRLSTERLDETTFGGLLARWGGQNFILYRRVAAVVMVIFLGAYAAAQLTAGGKTLQAMFGWSPHAGAVIGAFIVIVYCLAGGIRASIWTDAAQSVVMIVAMVLLAWVGVQGAGGLDGTVASFGQIPGFLSMTAPPDAWPGVTGLVLFVVGWLFAGLSVVGQPHIMVRFMALDTPGNMWRARAWYYGFFTVFYALATVVGMLSRLYLPDLMDMDPELALPTMAQELLPPVLVGVVLAGIFAATMSTADSLVLSCSACLTQDLPRQRVENKWRIKAATGFVVVLALAIALAKVQSVFSLVILAWSVLASAFAPLLFVYAGGGRPSQPQALAMTVVGVAVALAWRELGWHTAVYEGLPGILSGFVAYAVWQAAAAPARRRGDRTQGAASRIP